MGGICFPKEWFEINARVLLIIWNCLLLAPIKVSNATSTISAHQYIEGTDIRHNIMPYHTWLYLQCSTTTIILLHSHALTTTIPYVHKAHQKYYIAHFYNLPILNPH